MISANAYLGADVVCEALGTGAPIVLSGRVADPSLFLAPMMHEFGWTYDDLPKIAQGTAAGHLLECTASVTGGCFGWPGQEGRRRISPATAFPSPTSRPTARSCIGKTPGTGGRLDVMTCTEQLIYEIHDPTAYITPDCVLDITGIALTQESGDRVRVEGAKARPASTPTYKVNVGYADGYIGEGEVSYGGIDAVARAKWAAEIVKERLKLQGFVYDDFRVDLIGMSSLHDQVDIRPEPYEVRLRMAGRDPRPQGRACHRLRSARHAYARPGRRRRRLRTARARRAGGEIGAAAEESGQCPGGRGGLFMSVRVYDLAHARAGDKGNTSNISVICYDAKHWEFLERELDPGTCSGRLQASRQRTDPSTPACAISRPSTS